MGRDRVHFSTEHQYENMEDEAEWFDSTTVIGEDKRVKIGRTNAIRLFNLDIKG